MSNLYVNGTKIGVSVSPISTDATMTQNVGINSEGKLFTKPTENNNQEIIDGTITPKKTSFFNYYLSGINLINPSTKLDKDNSYENGQWNTARHNHSTYVIPVIEGHMYHNYRPVTPASGAIYYYHNTGYWNWKDDSGNIIEYSANNQQSATNSESVNIECPEGATQLWLCCPDSDGTISFTLYDATENPTIYNDYNGLSIPYDGFPFIPTQYLLGGKSDSINILDKLFNNGWIINPLKDKKILFFGDSIATGAGSGGFGFADAVNEIDPSCNCIDYAIGGAYFADKQESNPNRIITQMETAFLEHPDADSIVIEGGYNDLDRAYTPTADEYKNFDTSTMGGGIEECFYYAMTHWQGKKVFFVTCHKNRDWTDETMNEYLTSLYAICQKWGVPICDNMRKIGVCTELFNGTDTTYNVQIHPAKWFYQKYFAPHIIGFLRERM